MAVPRFVAAYEAKKDGQMVTTGVEEPSILYSGIVATWAVHGDTAFYSGCLVELFKNRFFTTSPGDTLRYRNKVYRRFTQPEVDALNIKMLKDGGMECLRGKR